MKKKLISLSLAALLLLALLPASALAAGDPKVAAPTNLVLSDELSDPTAGPQVPTGLRMKFTYGADFLKATAPLTEGGDSAYRARVMYEYRVDGGAWFPNPDNADPLWESDFGTDSNTYDELVVGFQPGFEENSHSWGAFENFKPALKTGTVDGYENAYYLDKANHTVEIRARYQLVDYNDFEAGTIYVSPWAEAKWGKGAVISKPTAFQTAPVLSDIQIRMDGVNKAPQVHFTAAHPADALAASTSPAGVICFRLEVNYDGVGWQFYHMAELAWLNANGDTWTNLPERDDGKTIVIDATKVQLRMRYEWFEGAVYHQLSTNGDVAPTFSSPWFNIIGINADAWSTASAWATPELEKADKAGLIPDCLKGQDLTKPINRAEFAAVAVKLYEAMTGKAAAPSAQNPFIDTKDPEVLKAYALGITKGTSATTFEPSTLIPREQVATMLTRTATVAKPSIRLDITGAAKFDDDAQISSWARESVYFMAKNGIVGGVGSNKFAPKNTTTAEIAAGYANATREQALLISVRSLTTLK